MNADQKHSAACDIEQSWVEISVSRSVKRFHLISRPCLRGEFDGPYGNIFRVVLAASTDGWLFQMTLDDRHARISDDKFRDDRVQAGQRERGERRGGVE